MPPPPYSPDLAISDYHLFTNMEKQLCGCVFTVNEEKMAAVWNVLDGFVTHFFDKDLKALSRRCEKRFRLNTVMRLNSSYAEKHF